MAITTKGVLDWILYEKAGSDHCRLIEFIKQFIEGKKNKLILMDNASCHRNQEVKDFIMKSKNDFVYIIYTFAHYEPMSYDLIKKSIRKSIKYIELKTYKNYFKSSLTKTKEDIKEIKMKYRKIAKVYKE
jgi:predicted CopG family antitoxin